MQSSLRELWITTTMPGPCLAAARLDALLAGLAATLAVSGSVGRVAIGTRNGWLVGGAVGNADKDFRSWIRKNSGDRQFPESRRAGIQLPPGE